MDRHISRTAMHISGHLKDFQNNDIMCSLPTSAGVNDPLEGYVVEPESIRLAEDKLYARATRIVNDRWRSICFSHVECEDNEIEAKIEDKIVQTHGYEYEYRDYIYGAFRDKLFFEFMNALAKLGLRIGGVAVKAHYWDQHGLADSDVGGIAFPPYAGFDGSYALASGIRAGKISNGKHSLSGDEVSCFLDDIGAVIPLKYKPAYGDEEEIRLSFYSFDGWESDEVSVVVDPEPSSLAIGRYLGSF